MDMRYLGATGMKVSSLCLGTMMFGPIGNKDVEDCVRIIHRALDTGINFIDTADVYSRGISEEICARALKDRREHVVLAESVLELGERAEREAEPVALAVERGLDLAPVAVDHVSVPLIASSRNASSFRRKPESRKTRTGPRLSPG